MSILTRVVSRATELRMPAPPGSAWGDTTPPANGQVSAFMAGGNGAGRPLTGIAAAWACIGVLADGIATLPLKQYRGYGADRVEVEPSKLITDPWPDAGQTDIDFRTQGQVSLAARGNFYGKVVERDKVGYPSMVQPLDIEKMRVTRNTDTGFADYRYGGKLIPVDDVFHIRNIMRSGSLVGMSPIEECRLTFELAMAAQQYGAAFFDNSANPGGVLQVPGELTPEETVALAKNWMAAHQGIGNSNLPAVLTDGVEWKQVSLALKDAQFIESRQLSTQELCMVYRVPPHMIGDVDKTTSWGTGIEQQELGWVRGGLSGYLARWEASLSALVPPDEYIKFDLKKRLRGDTLQRFQAWTLARNGGWMNADEIRDEEDQAPIPDGLGQGYLQPLNMATVGEEEEPTGTAEPVDEGESAAEKLAAVLMQQQGADRDSRDKRDAALLEALLNQPAPVVNVTTPDVHVAAPSITIEAPPPAEITVNTPDVHVEGPTINVESPAVTVEAAPPAEIHVESPSITVEAPVVHNHLPEQKAMKRTVRRDDNGEIADITDEPVE